MPAVVPADIAVVRALFLEYQEELGLDLAFQNFSKELDSLPGAYAPPRGRLLLAKEGFRPLGCVAMRDVGGGRVEMKRLFVRPEARGQSVGRALVERLVAEARIAGYCEIVLDTIPSMIGAQRLYEEVGFRDILPYSVSPLANTRYLGLSLGEFSS